MGEDRYFSKLSLPFNFILLFEGSLSSTTRLFSSRLWNLINHFQNLLRTSLKIVYDLNFFNFNVLCKAWNKLCIFNWSDSKTVYFVSFGVGAKPSSNCSNLKRDSMWNLIFIYFSAPSLRFTPLSAARPFLLSFNYSCQIRYCLQDTISLCVKIPIILNYYYFPGIVDCLCYQQKQIEDVCS